MIIAEDSSENKKHSTNKAMARKWVLFSWIMNIGIKETNSGN